MRQRILGLAVAVTLLALAVVALPLAFDIRTRIRAEEQSKLARLAALTAADISVEGAAGSDQIELPALPDSTTHLGVYSAGGLRRSGSGPTRLDTQLGPVRAGTVLEAENSTELVVAVPIAVDEQLVAVVRASEEKVALSGRVRSSWLRIALAAAAALAVASVLAMLLAQRLLRPLQRVYEAAQRIGGDDIATPPDSSGIPEIDAIARALSAGGQRVAASLVRERSFSADVSHQLRTPLTGLRLTLENELEHPRVDRREALHDALRDVDHLGATVESLLALSRDTATRVSAIDVGRVLRDRVEWWAQKFAHDHRVLVLDTAGPAAMAHVSPQAVTEIIDVLLDNARVHAVGTVVVSLTHRAAVAAVRVTDSGPGFADPSALFVRRDHAAKGTGIGLSLARRLAEAEGGSLSLAQSAGYCVFELRPSYRAC